MNELTPLNATEARALTDRIKVGVEAIWDLITQAYVQRAWESLGYSSWDDYCTREFGTSRLRLPREERSEVVASLRESGLSTRAIAAATGLSKDTVRRELPTGANAPVGVTGVNGKTYAPTQPSRSTTVIRDEDGEEAGRIVDDRDPNLMSDDEYDDMLAEEEREQWNTEFVEPVEIAPGITADQLAELNPQPKQQEPPAPRRRPITDAFDSATFNLKRAVESVVRLSEDDRLERNKDQIVGANLSDLVRVRDALNGVISLLEG
ncbi:hypothetical protein [Gordonia paraffinivorans]|uniref:hypothetical protein n=1 Tax=Gordonia paraffinivorans TaxID=175628 RepID=UPI003FCD80DF